MTFERSYGVMLRHFFFEWASCSLMACRKTRFALSSAVFRAGSRLASTPLRLLYS